MTLRDADAATHRKGSLRPAAVASLAVVILLTASACGSSSSSPPAETATGPWHATTANVRQLFNQQLGSTQSPDNYPRVIAVYCNGKGTCNVDAKGMKALCVYHAYVNFQ